MPKQYGTPGPRAIWPSIADSDPLAACSLPAQLLFERLISQADDQGRQEGDPVLVKAHCMPRIREATPRRIAGWIAELDQAGLITHYFHRGRILIQLMNWWDHQAGQRWAYPSRWPAPDGWPNDRVRIPQDSRNIPADRGHTNGVFPASAVAGAVALTNAGAGVPPPTPKPLNEEERREAIAKNLAIIEETQDPAIARAAQKAIEKLEAGR
jgi:hypothetical protein